MERSPPVVFCQKMLILSLFQAILILHIELERLVAVRVLITSVGVGSTDFFYLQRYYITVNLLLQVPTRTIFLCGLKYSQAKIPLSFFFALVKTPNSLCINAFSISHRIQLMKSQCLIIYITLHTKKRKNAPRNHCYKSINLHNSAHEKLCSRDQIPLSLCITTLCTE